MDSSFPEGVVHETITDILYSLSQCNQPRMPINVDHLTATLAEKMLSCYVYFKTY